MGDARKPTALDDQDKKLDPQNFAYISDDTYTVEEVEAQTQVGVAGARVRRARPPSTRFCAPPPRRGSMQPRSYCRAIHSRSQGPSAGGGGAQPAPPLPPRLARACVHSSPHPPPRAAAAPRLPQIIVDMVPEHLKKAPNTKMFLRSFWYRATLKGVAHADEMHIYTLARWGPGTAGGHTLCAGVKGQGQQASLVTGQACSGAGGASRQQR